MAASFNQSEGEGQKRLLGFFDEHTLIDITLDLATKSFIPTDRFYTDCKHNHQRPTAEVESCKSSIEDYVLLMNRRRLELSTLLHFQTQSPLLTDIPTTGVLEKLITQGMKWLEDLRRISTTSAVANPKGLAELLMPGIIGDRCKERDKREASRLLAAFAQQEREILG
ncbi:MAG: hypothetical protein Q9209_001096 [Squamulea sp. 1 TL-2023]